MSTRHAAPCLAPRWAAPLCAAAFLAALAPETAWADMSADLGGAQFSQRVVTEVVQRRAQVRALEACKHQSQQPPAATAPLPPSDLRKLPLSPPVGTAGPVPDGPHPCRGP